MPDNQKYVAVKRRAIITGASSGVGQACALLLASKGYNLIINYASNDQGALQTQIQCEKLGAQVLVIRGDVSDNTVCLEIVRKAIDKFEGVDVLVNNAGTTRFCNHHDLDGLSAQDFQDIYAVNAIAPFQMIRAVQASMKAQGKGSIVNVASMAGINGIGSSIAYCASKAALLNMTKSLARVLGPEIRVNAICPGFIEGEWLKAGLGEAYEKIKQKTEQQTPLKKVTTAEDIAEAIVMVIEGPALMTGEALIVDGGKHLN